MTNKNKSEWTTIAANLREAASDPKMKVFLEILKNRARHRDRTDIHYFFSSKSAGVVGKKKPLLSEDEFNKVFEQLEKIGVGKIQKEGYRSKFLWFFHMNSVGKAGLDKKESLIVTDWFQKFKKLEAAQLSESPHSSRGGMAFSKVPSEGLLSQLPTETLILELSRRGLRITIEPSE